LLFTSIRKWESCRFSVDGVGEAFRSAESRPIRWPPEASVLLVPAGGMARIPSIGFPCRSFELTTTRLVLRWLTAYSKGLLKSLGVLQCCKQLTTTKETILWSWWWLLLLLLWLLLWLFKSDEGRTLWPLPVVPRNVVVDTVVWVFWSKCATFFINPKNGLTLVATNHDDDKKGGGRLSQIPGEINTNHRGCRPSTAIWVTVDWVTEWLLTDWHLASSSSAPYVTDNHTNIPTNIHTHKHTYIHTYKYTDNKYWQDPNLVEGRSEHGGAGPQQNLTTSGYKLITHNHPTVISL